MRTRFKKQNKMKELYRYISDLSSEEFNAEIQVISFEIKRETNKGYWIVFNRKEKFVLKGGNGKRFAYETKELALSSFIKRKERQIEINKTMIARANEELKTALELQTINK